MLRETKHKIQGRVEKEKESLRIPITQMDALSSRVNKVKEEMKKACKKAVEVIHQKEIDLTEEEQELPTCLRRS